jgi:hypothetical protein
VDRCQEGAALTPRILQHKLPGRVVKKPFASNAKRQSVCEGVTFGGPRRLFGVLTRLKP